MIPSRDRRRSKSYPTLRLCNETSMQINMWPRVPRENGKKPVCAVKKKKCLTLCDETLGSEPVKKKKKILSSTHCDRTLGSEPEKKKKEKYGCGP
jgi:hypothetical protein